MDTRPSGKGKAKKYTRSTNTAYLSVNVNDCWNILSHALKNAGNDGARHVRGNTSTRFVLGVTFPANFGGATIHQNGMEEGCEFIAVVIETSPNVAIVTHFPASAGYFDGKTALT